ncbi:MAG: cytidine deaminase [Bacteroidales bacterium]|nr:cytidine deaminase [Bacteroidales bacterium]MDD4672357.1 cytidine deaminase [Bacteroidales bacterium]MDY0348927.1 cytidine deaminase [Tenuifilaceae bacterium]
MENRSLNIQYKEYSNTNDLPEEYKLLAQKAKEAVKTSYSPYSKFAVGAALLLENGEFILGSNQENGAYPSGLCAERVALFYAGSKYPKVRVKGLAIAASFKGEPVKEPLPPCGACRQVMMETQAVGKVPFPVIMVGENRVLVVDNAKFLLPFSFSNVSDASK